MREKRECVCVKEKEKEITKRLNSIKFTLFHANTVLRPLHDRHALSGVNDVGGDAVTVQITNGFDWTVNFLVGGTKVN